VGEEWVVLYLYDDNDKPSLANCTVGIGHLVHPGACDGSDSEAEFKNGITEERAYELFESDLYDRSEHYVHSYVSVLLTQYEYDALVSFVFNAGSGRFENSSTLAHLNQGDYEAAADAMESEYTGGDPPIIERRRKESQMFRYGIYEIKEPVIRR
jgi:lysozyme